MSQDALKTNVRWALVVTNAIAGVVWVLAAFGIVMGRIGTNPLYLALGLIHLAASGVWLLSLRSS
jgi:hypothetical protein